MSCNISILPWYGLSHFIFQVSAVHSAEPVVTPSLTPILTPILTPSSAPSLPPSRKRPGEVPVEREVPLKRLRLEDLTVLRMEVSQVRPKSLM